MSSFISLGLLGWLLLSVGCVEESPADAPDTEPDPYADCADGVRPEIADCFVGRDFAECGGTGDYRLGCQPDTGKCRWFVGGCVANGYVASACDWEDVCCVDGWPFAAGVISPERGPSVDDFLSQSERIPWNRTRGAAIAVTLDPTYAFTEAAYACDPPAGAHHYCADDPFYERRISVGSGGSTRIITFEQVMEYTGVRLEIEVLPNADDTGLIARGVHFTFGDITPDPTEQCAGGSRPIDPARLTTTPAEAEGALTLNGDPFVHGDIHGRFEGTAMGRTITATF